MRDDSIDGQVDRLTRTRRALKKLFARAVRIGQMTKQEEAELLQMFISSEHKVKEVLAVQAELERRQADWHEAQAIQRELLGLDGDERETGPEDGDSDQ